MEFCHLHVHSCYSFLDGLPSPEELAQRAAEMGIPALALTDHNTVAGAVKFQQACIERGVRPIQGAEVTLEGGSHLTLLAQGPEGYAGLCRLVTDGYLGRPGADQKRPEASRAAVAANAAGLFCLSGCARGEISRLILRERYREAADAARRLLGIYGPDRFFIEIQSQGYPFTRRLNRRLAQLAEHLSIGLVATHNVHYLDPADFPARDALVCVRTLTRIDDAHPDRPLNAQEWMLTPAEMERRFLHSPEALANTARIAERCRPALDLDARLFPRFADLEPGESSFSKLVRLVFRGAAERYGSPLKPNVKDRLRHELEIIRELDFTDYFLAVWDVAQFARRQGIRFSGRGSAADSAAAYCLGLTNVDSVARGLLFERFLSLERAQIPDIDLDFDARRRDDVTRYVYEKYGAEHVATVCTFNTYQGRSAVRDLGKAMGFPEEEISRLSTQIPGLLSAGGGDEALARVTELRGSDLSAGALPAERYRSLVQLCARVAGKPRFIGMHLGGVVISARPLTGVASLQRSAKGPVIVQLDKDDVEEVGLIKLDLLCLRTLSAVEDTLETLAERGTPVDYARIPIDDPETFEMIRASETIGAFQIESPGQRALQSRLGADRFEDIVASVALIRPGPIQGDMVKPFVERRRGREPVTYLHPALEPILKETFGVVLYQEQVIEIAMAIAGFTAGEGDRLRKQMSHARSGNDLEGIGGEFIRRAVERGIEREVAETVFSYVKGYAGFGFCEAHAAAFGDTAMRTSYLLRRHPAAFIAALLSNQPMGFYPSDTLCLAARRRGIDILPPDINRSGARFIVPHPPTPSPRVERGATSPPNPLPGAGEGEHLDPSPQPEPHPPTPSPLVGEGGDLSPQPPPRSGEGEPDAGGGGAIRVSLSQVRGMTQAALDSILSARAEAPFRSAIDFCRRTAIPRNLMENLVLCGAFDRLHANRRALFWGVEAIRKRVPLTPRPEPHPPTPSPLVERGSSPLTPQPPLPQGERGSINWEEADEDEALPHSALRDFTEMQKFAQECRILGLSVSCHSMAYYRAALQERGIASSGDLARRRNGDRVRVGGMVLRPHRPPTKSGRVVVFFCLEDEFGIADVTVFESVYRRFGTLIYTCPTLIVEGRLERRGGYLSVLAQRLWPFPDDLRPADPAGSPTLSTSDEKSPGWLDGPRSFREAETSLVPPFGQIGKHR